MLNKITMNLMKKKKKKILFLLKNSPLLKLKVMILI